MRKVSTARFGEIEIEEEKVIQFSAGIPAFEEEQEFVIIPYDEESPFVFLQSLQTAELAFLMTSPFVFFPEYQFEIDDDSIEVLGIKKEEDLLIYTLLTLLGKDIKQMTANLLAPIVINQQNHQAKQIILEKSEYKTKHLLFPAQDIAGGDE